MPRTKIILSDIYPQEVYPLTYTRSVSDISIGYYTIKEKWCNLFKNKGIESDEIKIIVRDHLFYKYRNDVFLESVGRDHDCIFINLAVLPDIELVDKIFNLKMFDIIEQNGDFIAGKETPPPFYPCNDITKIDDAKIINKPWDILKYLESEIISDINYLHQNGHKSGINNKIHNTSCINTDNGPVWLGQNVTVEEFALIRGPAIIGDNTIIKAFAQIKGPVTIGKSCKVGGEVEHSIIMNYTNKSHAGYLGRSIIGEWCNLGANTTTSTLKNNYSNIRINDIDTGELFLGTFTGDYVNTAVNTVFNPGTIIGCVCNVFSEKSSVIPRELKSFSWGIEDEDYEYSKAIETIRIKMKRRNVEMSKVDKQILLYIFSHSS